MTTEKYIGRYIRTITPAIEARAFLGGIAEGTFATAERCAEAAADWFTLPPRERTKAKLLAMIRATVQE